MYVCTYQINVISEHGCLHNMLHQNLLESMYFVCYIELDLHFSLYFKVGMACKLVRRMLKLRLDNQGRERILRNLITKAMEYESVFMYNNIMLKHCHECYT